MDCKYFLLLNGLLFKLLLLFRGYDLFVSNPFCGVISLFFKDLLDCGCGLLKLILQLLNWFCWWYEDYIVCSCVFIGDYVDNLCKLSIDEVNLPEYCYCYFSYVFDSLDSLYSYTLILLCLSFKLF